MKEKEWVSSDQVAEHFGVTPATVRRWVTKGQVPFIRISRPPQSLCTCTRELVEHVAFTLAELLTGSSFAQEAIMPANQPLRNSNGEYLVEVIGHFYFDPFLMPINVDYSGFALWRVFRLPFVPYNGLLWGNAIASGRSCWGCNAMELEEVVWCPDRHMFTASTKPHIWSTRNSSCSVLQAVAELLEAGWLGLEDDGEGGAAPQSGRRQYSAQNRDSAWSTLLKWNAEPTVLQGDSDVCRKLRDALVRLTFWVGDGSIAYALDHTGLLLGDVPQDAQDEAQWRRWVEAKQAYHQLPVKQSNRWSRKVLKEYPDLIDLVRALQQQISEPCD